jgi:hypothetical protein
MGRLKFPTKLTPSLWRMLGQFLKPPALRECKEDQLR